MLFFLPETCWLTPQLLTLPLTVQQIHLYLYSWHLTCEHISQSRAASSQPDAKCCGLVYQQSAAQREAVRRALQNPLEADLSANSLCRVQEEI